MVSLQIGDRVTAGYNSLTRGMIKEILPARKYRNDTETIVIEEEDGSESYWCPEDVYRIEEQEADRADL